MILVQNIALGIDNMVMRDITAYELVAEMNVGISIGNSLDSVGKNETSWGNPTVTKELINAYKNAGFNTIRLPVTWSEHMESDGTPETSWLNRVEEVVNWILDEGLYCIINTHHEGGWLHTSSDGMTLRKYKFKTLWIAISNRFKNYGDHLLFEGFNEIQKKAGDWSQASDEDYQNSNELSQLFVDSVRSTGGNNLKRVLIISTYGAIHTTLGFELPKDVVKNKLAVEFHCYYPQQFCFEWGTQKTWGSKNDLLEVKSFCSEFSGFTNEKIPVILGEFGAVDKENDVARAEYAETVAKNCNQYGIKAIWWDNGNTGVDKFGIVDRYTYKVLKPEIISALVNNSYSTPVANKTTPNTKITDEPKSTSPSSSNNSNILTNTSASLGTDLAEHSSTTTKVVNNIYVDDIIKADVTFLSINTVNIKWNNVKNAKGYVVYKSENGKTKKFSARVSNEFYDVLSRGKTYKYYIVPFVGIDGKTFYSKNKKVVKVSVLSSKISKINKKIAKTKASFNINNVIGAQKYEIKYSIKKNMKNAKSKVSSSNKICIKHLKKNKKYFASIRAFAIINGKKIYTSQKKVSFKTKI